MTKHADVRSYYTDEWGKPDREAIFEKDGFRVGVLKWQAGEATQGVNFYATVGASEYPLPGRPSEHRHEFFAALVPEFDDVASPLARLGIFAQLTGGEVGAGHSYRALHGIAEGSGLEGFVILEPPENYPAPLSLSNGRHVEFLMAVPVHGNELDYAASNGVGELLKKMEDANTPIWNAYRSSVFG